MGVAAESDIVLAGSYYYHYRYDCSVVAAAAPPPCRCCLVETVVAATFVAVTVDGFLPDDLPVSVDNMSSLINFSSQFRDVCTSCNVFIVMNLERSRIHYLCVQRCLVCTGNVRGGTFQISRFEKNKNATDFFLKAQ